MKLTCGIDWAEAHHDVALVDEDGVVVARARIDTGADRIQQAAGADRRARAAAPGDTPVAIETDKNLLVVALVEAGFTVYPINPRAVARYRERYGQAGGKSDPGDAAVLANILRTDRHLHRPMPAVSEQGRAVKALARQHQEAIWALHQTVSRLRSVLLEFYPQALQAFPKLTAQGRADRAGGRADPGRGQQLTRRRVVALLQRSRPRQPPALVEQILTDLHDRRPAAAAAGRAGTRPDRDRAARHRRRDAASRRRPRDRTGPRVRPAPAGGDPALGTRPGPDPRRPRPWPRSVTIQHGSPTRTVCARSPAPRR